MTHPIPYLSAACIALCAAQPAYSAATRIAYVDPFATARGNAFTATADNPSAVFYNAAGLTQLEGTQVQANIYAFSAQYEYSGALGDAESDSDLQPIPSFFASHHFKDSPYSIGFGMYAPFGIGMDWGNNVQFAPVAYEAELAYIKYHAVFAWKATETLSLAAGISFDDGDLELNSIGPLGSFDGDDRTVGFSFSVLWQPSPEHSFGLNYQAASEMDFKGTSTVFGPAEANLEFPESIVLGYSWRPNERWNFEFNLDWTNWDRVDDLTFSSAAPDIPVALNWESAFIWELGATRYFDNGLHLSAGYTYVENAVPDEDFSPIVPDADRHFLQLGVGGEIEQFTWQLTGQYTYAEPREVDGNVSGFGLPNGEYDLDSFGISVALGYSF